MEICKIPNCNAKIIKRCKCQRNDQECANGHWTHKDCKTGEIHEGHSDHSSEICCEEKKVVVPVIEFIKEDKIHNKFYKKMNCVFCDKEFEFNRNATKSICPHCNETNPNKE